MKKTRFWIILLALLLSLGLTGAALAAASNQEGGETAPAIPLSETNGSILSVSYVYTNSTPVAIPDASCPTRVTSVINVPDSFIVGDLNVGLWIPHTWRSDINVQLRAPNGTTVVQLVQDPDGSADNINALIDDGSPNIPDSVNHNPPPPYYYAWWRTVGNLSSFNGMNAQGNWTLEVCDDAGGDTGTLTTWTLFFKSGVVLNPPNQSGQACKGSDVVYNYTVLNATTITQSLSLTYNSTWPVYGPATTPVLAPGQSWNFQVTHHIPWSATPGNQNTLTVTASSSNDSSTATATTTVGLVLGWQDYANVPAGREVRAPSVVYWNGKLYKIGGYGGTGAAQAWLDIYDIATNTWTQGANMPGPRYWLDCVAIDLTGSAPKIYCAGGYSTTATNTLYIYDINTNSWTTGATLPASRYHYAAVALDNRYYVIGGYTTVYESSMVVYNPATNTWDSTRAPMSTTRRYHSAGVIGGMIYVAGGYNGAYLNSAERYNPATNTWSAIAPMPSPWLNAADGVKHDRYLVLAGGSANSTASADNRGLIYDANTNTWQWLPLMDHQLYSAEGDSDGTNFWVVSGRLYAGGSYSYSPYTTLMVQCAAACTPVSGADFTWDPLQPWANWPATFNGTAAGGTPAINYTWDFGDGGSGQGQTLDYTYLLTGTYTVVMTATNCDGASTSVATHDVTVILPPTISVDPESLHSTQNADEIVTQTLEICNLGDYPLSWELSEAEAVLNKAPAPAPLALPAPQPEIMRLPDGSVDCAAYQNYTGFEPAEVAQACGNGTSPLPSAGMLAPDDIGYALDIGYISDNFVWFYLNNFPGQTVIGLNATPFYGMDFDPSATTLYALNDTTDELGVIDLTTGAFTGLVPCPPGGGAANWTGLTIDPVTGVFYASTATDLYTIDPNTGVSTLIGPFGTTLMIDIAMNTEGEMYGHDIGTDSIYSINPATGAATLIGPTGYNANYAQGMDFDNDDGTLYIFLYQGSGANVYGTVNLLTGAVTPLAVSNPLGEFEGAIQIPGFAYDIPWVSEDPISGTLAGGTCQIVDVIYDSTGLAVGEYYGLFEIESNDPATALTTVPVTLTVIQQADLQVTKSDDPDPVDAGQPLYYTLSVTNNGPSASSGAVLTDTLPTGFVFVSASPDCSETGGVLTCAVGALSVSETAIFTAHVVPPTPGVFTNTVEVLGFEEDPDLGNNTAEESTTVLPYQVTFVYHDLEDVVREGESVYLAGSFNGWNPAEIAMTPNGDFSVFTVTLELGLQDYEYKYIVYTDTAPVGPAHWDWLQSYPDGSNRTIGVVGDITVHDYRDIVPGYYVLQWPEATTTTVGVPTENIYGQIWAWGFTNEGMAPRAMLAELGYGTDADPTTWATWDSMIWNGQVGNNAEYMNVITPTATGVYSYAVRFNANWGEGNPNNLWYYGDLNWDGTYDPADAGVLTVLELPPEAADLALTKADDPDPVLAGGLLTYTLTVENLGPNTATNTILTDTLPTGVTFQSASAGCTEASGIVTCALGDIPAGESVVVTIVVLAPDTAGVIANTAVVASAAPDPNLANNTASAETTVEEPPVIEYYIYLPIIRKATP